MHGDELNLRFNAGSLLCLFQMVGACLPMSAVGLIVVLFVVFVRSAFKLTLVLLLCFITNDGNQAQTVEKEFIIQSSPNGRPSSTVVLVSHQHRNADD